MMTVTNLTPELFRDSRAELAEGPTWDAGTSTLVWVDILANRVWREPWGKPSAAQCFETPSHVGAALFSTNPGELLLLLRDGFYRRDGEGTLTALAQPLSTEPGIRFNDGKVSPDGRAFGGTMPYNTGPTDGALYRLDAPGDVVTCVSGLAVSNGLGWSPDGSTMYLIDSGPGRVWRYQYDAATGAMTGGTVLVQLESVGGSMPDGLTVDDEGCLWVAVWGGGQCRRYTPDGRLDRTVLLPVSQPTSMCFVGPRLDTLLITTASYGLDAARLEREPLAGGLFVLDAPCTGPAATPWRAFPGSATTVSTATAKE